MLPDQTGANFRRRAVYPPAIMPGDGGVGVLVGAEAFRNLRNQLPIIHGATVFASGHYLINARDTNGTPSMVQSLGVPLAPIFLDRLTNSVTDSYMCQAGASLKIPGTWDKPALKGLRLRATMNWEGVPGRDFIGRSNGFRQSGYAFSVGPGLSYTRGKHYLSVDVPIVFYRNMNPNQSLLPGLPPKGQLVAAPVNFDRQMALVVPVSVVIRYARAI